MAVEGNLKRILDVAVTLRKDDKIAVVFLLTSEPESGRHVIQEIISSISITEENGLFQQFLLQYHVANPTQLDAVFIEACAIIQNYRIGRFLGFSKEDMLSGRFSDIINPIKKSLYLLADSLTDEQMRYLISKLDDGENNQCRYLEYVFLDWQLRGVFNMGPELDSTCLEKLKNCLCDRKIKTERHSLEEFYPILDKNDLGYCIIINNSTFTSNEGLKELMPAQKLPPRNGSDRDVDSLNQVFTSFNFTVKIHTNVPYDELKNLLSFYASSISSTHSFLIFIFMSHGTEDVVYTSDSVPVSVEALEMTFQRNSCPQMTGKPKILVIQACQGDNLQNIAADGAKPPSTLATLSLGPERGDALIAWSTVKGYASFRDRTEGSWFIQELCKELKASATSRDLVDIVTRVNNQLRSKTHFGMFMVPSLSTSLCKKIKFV